LIIKPLKFEIMKKFILIFALLFSVSIAFTGCRDEKKSPEDKIEATIDDVNDDIEEDAEALSDDVNDAIEDVEEEIEEAKEDND